MCEECSGFGLREEYVKFVLGPQSREKFFSARPEPYCHICTMGVIRSFYDKNLVELQKKYLNFKAWYEHSLQLAKIDSDFYLGYVD